MNSFIDKIIKVIISGTLLFALVPSHSSLTINRTDQGAEGTESYGIFLPLITNGNPKTLIYITDRIDTDEPDGDIYKIKANGTELVNLTNSPSGYFDLTWSPDGSRIAFYMNEGGLFIMDPDSQAQTQIASGSEPSWSPDSSMIVFVPNYMNFATLSIINSDGSGLRELVSMTDGMVQSPQWSPNSNKIVYNWFDYLGHSDIYIVYSDGSGLTNLTNGFGGWEPIWSPDGSHILFLNHGDIYIMNADGTGRTNISNSPYYNTTCVWSSDGTKIAFDCNHHICIMNPDGSGKIDVSGDYGYSPAWAPDDSVIAYIEPGLNDSIIFVKPDGTGKTLLTDLPLETSKSQVSWQP